MKSKTLSLKRTGFSKENSYYSMTFFRKIDLLLLADKLIEKIPNPSNAKEFVYNKEKQKVSKTIKNDY